MAFPHKCSIIFITSAVLLHLVTAQSFNPTILQDSRDLPKVDGTFGFLYRTEDGIAHAAKGDSDGVIHGRFSYTDPTGLKVNYNYNAGSRVAPGYHEPAPPPRPQYHNKKYQPQYQYEDDGQYQPQPQYEPQPQVRVPSRAPPRPQYREPVQAPPRPQYREPVQAPPQRRTRPPVYNEVYEDYNN